MAQISLRVDDNVKRRAEQALNEIGLSMSTAINVFLRTVAREKRIPFELNAEALNEQRADRVVNSSVYRDITREELDVKIGKGLNDVKEGKLTTAEEVENSFKNTDLNIEIYQKLKEAEKEDLMDNKYFQLNETQNILRKALDNE